MARTLINAPKTARKGEIIEIKAMIAHPMETGYRVGTSGQPIPREIIHHFVCTYNGEEVFAAEFFPAIAANPFLAFSTVATASGTLSFAWTDDKGETQTATTEITVT
jgi:sulfur-oxidizing protein SoxZ